MKRLLIVLALLLPAQLFADRIKLYLKDGSYHIVSEYEVKEDRIRFYSLERSQWEEIPLELMDLKRTEKEKAAAEAEEAERARLFDAEEKADREARREIEKVPYDPGVYWAKGDEIVPLKAAETEVVTNKRRNVLKVLAPIPIVTGKATVEIKGEKSTQVITDAEPKFYFRLSSPQRFALVKLKPQKDNRLVENITIVPVSNEMIEEREEIEIFRRQVGEQLYQIWPMAPLAPGEYAAIEFTDGKVNLQVWDFSVRAGK